MPSAAVNVVSAATLVYHLPMADARLRRSIVALGRIAGIQRMDGSAGAGVKERDGTGHHFTSYARGNDVTPDRFGTVRYEACLKPCCAAEDMVVTHEPNVDPWILL